MQFWFMMMCEALKVHYGEADYLTRSTINIHHQFLLCLAAISSGLLPAGCLQSLAGSKDSIMLLGTRLLNNV